MPREVFNVALIFGPKDALKRKAKELRAAVSGLYDRDVIEIRLPLDYPRDKLQLALLLAREFDGPVLVEQEGNAYPDVRRELQQQADAFFYATPTKAELQRMDSIERYFWQREPDPEEEP